MSNRSVWSTDRAQEVLQFRARLDMGAMAMKGYSAFPIKVASPSDFYCHIKDTRLRGVLQRRSQFILRSQPTGLIKSENERNQRRNRTLKTRQYQNSEKEGIWNIGNGYQKTSRHEKNMRIEYLRRIEKKSWNQTLQQKSDQMKSNCIVPFVGYWWQFLILTKVELRKLDQKTRQLKTMHKDFHARDDIYIIYGWRKTNRRRSQQH